VANEIDLNAAQAMMNLEAKRRRAEAPTNLRELQGYLLYAIGLPMAAVYQPVAPMLDVVPARNRFEALWHNDAVFRYAVRAAVNDVLHLLDDMNHTLGREPLR
jgi:hypothetical protein